MLYNSKPILSYPKSSTVIFDVDNVFCNILEQHTSTDISNETDKHPISMQSQSEQYYKDFKQYYNYADIDYVYTADDKEPIIYDPIQYEYDIPYSEHDNLVDTLIEHEQNTVSESDYLMNQYFNEYEYDDKFYFKLDVDNILENIYNEVGLTEKDPNTIVIDYDKNTGFDFWENCFAIIQKTDKS